MCTSVQAVGSVQIGAPHTPSQTPTVTPALFVQVQRGRTGFTPLQLTLPDKISWVLVDLYRK